jgi:hypothetical protein
MTTLNFTGVNMSKQYPEPNTSIEEGVMVVNKEATKGWGLVFSDGRETAYGWVPLPEALVLNPEYCKNPLDLAPQVGGVEKRSMYEGELRHASFAQVKRVVNLRILKKVDAPS